MATNEHSGYPLKWFDDPIKVKNAYECAKCLDILEDAVQIQACGHQFCALCVEDILKVDPHCPSCRTEILNTSIIEDHATRRLIKQLNVNCCNEGCSWHETLGSLLQLRPSKNPWVPPEKLEKELSREEKETAELYRNVVAILNKITPQKFKTLVEQILALNIDTPERLEGVVDRMFEKAIREQMYSAAYANMCRCLFSIKVTDADKKDVSFRKLLLNRCQKEFEKEKEDEQALAEKYSHLEGLPEEERKVKKEEMDEALAKNKRRMLGNIKFIGELFKLKLLTETIMHDCIFKLLRAGDEESLESMCKLLSIIGKNLDSDKAKPRIEQYFDQINKIISGKKVSPRVTFLLRDVVELRENKWVPRREERFNPQTINQIHKEAHMEKLLEQRLAAQLSNNYIKKKYDWQGRRGRNSPNRTPNDGWIITGKSGKPVAIDQNKLRHMAKRGDYEKISRFDARGPGRSTGFGYASQVQEKPEELRFSAFGSEVPSDPSYDPTRPSSGVGSRPSSGGSRERDKGRLKSDKDRESALEALRVLIKPQQELYRNVMAILNKITRQKFKTLVEQILALNIDTRERLEGVIDRIFEKAIREEMFSDVYAKMCRCLFSIKVTDADKKHVSFRKLLLTQCQKEFIREKEDEQALKEKYSHLERLPEEERKVKKEEMDEALAKNKRRMLGSIKFIGELFKLKLLTETIMHDCIFKLLRSGDEESLESMCKLLFTIGKDLDSDKAKPRIEQYFDQINKIISGKKVSSRVTFMLRDVVELRENKWVPRREEHYNPKTIDQIHKEAHMEKLQEQRLAAQLPNKDNKQKKGGQGGGRDSPKPTQNDGWITTGKSRKPVAIDQNKLRTMAKRANNEEIPLGPSSRFGQWGRGSSAGISNASQEPEQPQGNRYSALSSGGDMASNRPYDPRRSSSGSKPLSGGPRGSDKGRIKSDKDRESALEAVRALTKRQNEKSQNEKPRNEKSQFTQPPPVSQEKQEFKEIKEAKQPVKEALSEEELMKKTIALIDEYINVLDLKEAITCFTDLHSPALHDLFVLSAVEHTYEMKPKARHNTGKLFAELLSQNKLTKDQLTSGFNKVLEVADDNAIDYPMLWKYLAEIITPVILRRQFTLSDLMPHILEHLVPVGTAGNLLAEILIITKEKEGENMSVKIWKDVGINWSDVLPERLSKEEFLSRKNLTFLLNETNDELLTLLRADQFKNDIIFAHIEEKRKEAEFISQLVTAVAESCIINKDNSPDCCQDKLKARKDILRKYLDNNNSLELEALFALQGIYVKYNKPAGMLSQFFNTLYDEEVITEEAFMNWKQDENPSRQEAKGPALQATSSFFEWLQSATVEGSEN